MTTDPAATDPLATKQGGTHDRRFLRRLIGGAILNPVLFGAPLFLPAGTLDWWRAWFFVGVTCVGTIVTMLVVFRNREDLLDERMKPIMQPGQPLADRILVILLLIQFFGLLLFIPIDVFHLHLMPRPPLVVSSSGMVLLIAGWWIISLVFQANAFAAPVVKHQAERHQVVVDRGPYAVVRHPMYAGCIPLMVGIALWHESYAAALLIVPTIVTLAVRIHFEEQFLRRELHGYEAYTHRVRYRLISFLW